MVVHKNGAGGDVQSAAAVGIPGVGGVSRGRADAELIWGEESPGRLEDFEAELLTRAERLDLERSELLGIGATTPRTEAEGEAAGNVDVEASLGRSTWRRRLAPRHREAVSRFFSRDE